MASQGEIVHAIRAAMLLRDDVLDMVGQLAVSLVEAAVLTNIAARARMNRRVAESIYWETDPIAVWL